MSEEKMEDLNKELTDALDKSKQEEEPAVETPPVEKPTEEKPVVEPAEQVDEPAVEADPKEDTPETPKAEDKVPHQFKNVKEFLEAVQDEPSRNLLDNFYKLMKAETSAILSPIEQKNNETRFETEFSKYEKIEGLADHKNGLRKTFLRDPSQDIKKLVGEVVTDLQLNKIKPIEKTPSTPNRAKADTSKLSKDELYEMLENLKE
jgi:hypothetical protein